MLRTLGNLKNGYNEITNMDTVCQNMKMDIGVQKMKSGEILTLRDFEKETALNLLEGKVLLKWEGKEVEAARKSVFDENPSVLHFPKEVEVLVEALQNTELLIQKTTNKEQFEVKFYRPEDCRTAVWGEGLWDETAKRNVRFVIEYKNAPYSNLILGEIVNYPGRWSTFIPHTHDQPEVYYYRFDKENGFGAGFVGDDVYKIQNNSATCIPGRSMHPQVSAPGYALYICWMMRNLDGNPFVSKTEDDKYKWLLDDDVKIWPDK